MTATPHMANSTVWHYYRETYGTITGKKGGNLRQESCSLIVGPDGIIWSAAPHYYTSYIGESILTIQKHFKNWNLEKI